MLSTLPFVQAAGFDVRIAVPPDGPLAEAIRERDVPLVAWRGREELAGVLMREKPDLVHANSLSTSRLSGPTVATFGLPSVGHIRDIVKLSVQAVADVNRHRRLVAVSRATRDFHVSQGINAKRCVAIHNGVDLAEFAPGPATGYLHRELSLPPGTRFVAVIGQIGLRKGTDVALTAAWQLAGRFPEVHWLVVGERTSEKEESRDFERLVHDIAAERPLAGRVHFLGPRRDVATLLNECALLVHAARQEPLARVLLEAAACGLAVVATDVGGTAEIFPPDANAAMLVSPNDHVALADAIAGVLSDEAQRVALGRAARARAETAFDVRHAAARLIEQYRAVL